MNIKLDAAGNSANTPAARSSNKHYQISNNKTQGRFNKSKLPYPLAVLDRLGIKHGRANSGGFWQLHCPFHKNGNEEHPSLNLHQVDGYFLCHACGAKGGDILAFYMQVTGTKFRDAAKELGALEVIV